MKRAPITCGGTQAKVCSRCASAFAGWSQRDAPTRTMRTSSFAGSGDCDVRSRNFLSRPCSAPVISADFPGLRAVCRFLHPPAPILQGFTGPTLEVAVANARPQPQWHARAMASRCRLRAQLGGARAHPSSAHARPAQARGLHRKRSGRRQVNCGGSCVERFQALPRANSRRRQGPLRG
jgi:hypothetical protein